VIAWTPERERRAIATYLVHCRLLRRAARARPRLDVALFFAAAELAEAHVANDRERIAFASRARRMPGGSLGNRQP
jgi:hypothetical protein